MVAENQTPPAKFLYRLLPSKSISHDKGTNTSVFPLAMASKISLWPDKYKSYLTCPTWKARNLTLLSDWKLQNDLKYSLSIRASAN